MKYLVFLFLGFLFSCKSEKSMDIRNVSDVLPIDSSVTVKVTGEKLPLDLLNPLSILCIDTMLLVYQHFEELMVKAYGVESGQMLGAFLRKGGGPDEVSMFNGFTQSFYDGQDPQIVIQSYPQYIGILDLNETLKSQKVIYKKKYSFVDNERNSLFASSNIAFSLYKDVFLLTKAPERSGRLEDGNTYFELYDYGKNEVLKSFYATDLPFIPNAFELYKGSLTLKEDREKIALFMRFMPVFSITDIESGVSKQFFPFGKEENLQKYIDIPGHYYWSAYSTTDRIVALYKGGVDPLAIEDESLHSYFHIFDWNGRLLYKIEVEDNIKCISLNGKTGDVYAVLMNDEIKRYSLEQYLRSYLDDKSCDNEYLY